MQGNIPKRNPMHNFETTKNFANYSGGKVCSNSSPFDFDSGDSDDDIHYVAKVASSVSNDIAVSVNSFKEFSATLSGGFRSQKFINMDKSNLLNLINHIGGRCLFDAVKLNTHIGNELKCGKSPSTLQQRLYSF